MRVFLTVASGLAFVLSLAGVARADSEKPEKNKGEPESVIEDVLKKEGAASGAEEDKRKNDKVEHEKKKDTRDSQGITEAEAKIIKDYIRERRESGQGLPPGLAKREELPPGLEKHVECEGRLPPGLEMQRLPGDLLARLPKRVDEEYLVVSDDVVLVEKGTEIVLDVLKDVLAGQ